MMTSGTDFELRLAAFADLAREGRPPERNARGSAPPVHAALRPRRRAPDPAASTRAADTVAPDRISRRPKDQHLDRAQARAIYTAASFLGQAYGQCFNLLLVFHHHGEDHASGVDTLTNFHRRARQRLLRRGQALFPFLYVHEAASDGRLSTRFACRVEFERDRDFLAWIETGFTPSRAGRRTTFGEIRRREGHARGERVAFHHRCVRELLRGVDPSLEARDEKGRHARLIDCLGVRTDERRFLDTITCPQRYGTADALNSQSQAAADDALPLLTLMTYDRPTSQRMWKAAGLCFLVKPNPVRAGAQAVRQDIVVLCSATLADAGAPVRRIDWKFVF